MLIFVLPASQEPHHRFSSRSPHEVRLMCPAIHLAMGRAVGTRSGKPCSDVLCIMCSLGSEYKCLEGMHACCAHVLLLQLHTKLPAEMHVSCSQEPSPGQASQEP